MPAIKISGRFTKGMINVRHPVTAMLRRWFIHYELKQIIVGISSVDADPLRAPRIAPTDSLHWTFLYSCSRPLQLLYQIRQRT